MSKPQDILLDHDYDGIKEFDNNLPPWWIWLFYITILFAVIYLFHYHVFGTGLSSDNEYLQEMNPDFKPQGESDSFIASLTYHSPLYTTGGDWTPKQRAEIAKMVEQYFNAVIISAMSNADEINLNTLKGIFPDIYQRFTSGGGVSSPKSSVTTAVVVLEDVSKLTDNASLTSGKTIFDNNCVSCHGKQGEGNIGPNLTDEFWIHGGSFPAMVHTIKKGVPIKGMISWEKQMSHDDIIKVGSYISTFQGTNPSNGKAPQGDKYSPETADTVVSETTG